MNLELLRFSSTKDSTSGILSQIKEDGSKEFLAYTVEDPYREKKVKHITRFADGRYQIKFRSVGGFHSRYLQRYGADYHKGMLELQNVKGYSDEEYKYVLIHSGNSAKSSSGCVIIGDTQTNNQIKEFGWVGSSRNNYLRTYQIIRDALLKGDEVWINVIDYDHKPKEINSSEQTIKIGGGIFCRQCQNKFTIQ